MFAVIFEMQPRPSIATPTLLRADCFAPSWSKSTASSTTFAMPASLGPDGVLSLSSWRDEKALVRWRTPRAASRNAELRPFTDLSRTTTYVRGHSPR
jgi:hypothetical protein